MAISSVPKKFRCVAVSSPSFSKSSELVAELGLICDKLVLNDKNLKFTESSLIEWLNELEADGCIIGTDPLTRAGVDRLNYLKAIGKYGVGCDNIDVDAVREHGIFFGWEGGVNKRSVSELALAFMLGHCRNVLRSADRMQCGQWNKDGGVQLSNRKIGIVGLGFIGTDLAKILRSMDCDVSYCDIADKSAIATQYGLKKKSYETLVRESEIITFHVPQDRSTTWMFGPEQISMCQKGALVVNTARGKIVDFEAVCAAVKAKNLGGYASDVFPDEPLVEASNYKIADGFYFTPHIGGNAYEAVLNMGQSAIRGLVTYLHR